MVIEKVIQTKSRGKKSLGFGKNDLNMMRYISMLLSIQYIISCVLPSVILLVKRLIRSSYHTEYIISYPFQQVYSSIIGTRNLDCNKMFFKLRFYPYLLMTLPDPVRDPESL